VLLWSLFKFLFFISKFNKKIKMDNFSVVDLFCGVGGLTHGFVLESFKVVAGIDSDKTCAYAYNKNNLGAVFYHDDLNRISNDDIKRLFLPSSKKILVGCAPCQDFSVYNQNNNQSGKYKLLERFARIIDEIQPEIISMENVPNLLNYEKGTIFQFFLSIIEQNYTVSYSVVNAKDYGIPQRRKRLVLLGCKKDKGTLHLLTPEEFKKSGVMCLNTVREAIGNLEIIGDGEISQNDSLHRARKLSALNKKRIKATNEGGFWRDWPQDLILDCHKKEAGKSFGSVYGRMKWDEESPTMTTYCVGLGNGRFGHPEQDRAISLREAAIFQSFPYNYEFINPNVPFSMMNIARQIGNAVPVNLGRVIAQSIKKHIKSSDYE